MSYETFDGGSLVSGPVSPGNYNIDTLADYLTKSKIVLTEKKPLKITTYNHSSALAFEKNGRSR